MSKTLHTPIEGRDEQLIELVRKHPELYNQNHPRYTYTKHKQKVWNTIGAFIEEDGMTCKVRWNNIRDNYRKSIRKNITQGGNRIYKFTTLLGFLKDYIEDIEIKSSWPKDFDQESQSSSLPPASPSAPRPPDEDPLDGSVPDSDHDVFFKHLVMKDEVIEPDSKTTHKRTGPLEAPATTHTPAIADDNDPGPTKRTTRIVRRTRRPLLKRTFTDPATTIATATESSPRVLEYLINKLETAASPDPDDAFLAGLGPALKNLHPYYRNLAKSEIFSAIQKYELKMLTEPLPDHHSAS